MILKDIPLVTLSKFMQHDQKHCFLYVNSRTNRNAEEEEEETLLEEW